MDIKTNIDELEDTGLVYESIKEASKYHLEGEFMMYFIRGIREGMSVLDACNYAINEWDI